MARPLSLLIVTALGVALTAGSSKPLLTTVTQGGSFARTFRRLGIHSLQRRGSLLTRRRRVFRAEEANRNEAESRFVEAIGINQEALSKILTDIVYNSPDIQSSRVLSYDRFLSEYVTDNVSDALSEEQRSQLALTVSTFLERYDIQLDTTRETDARVALLDIDEKKALKHERRTKRKFLVKFTCNKCMNPGLHRISFDGWTGGTVLATCHSCGALHLLTDHLQEMDFKGFKSVTDVDSQKALGKSINVSTIADSRLLNEAQLAEYGLRRNKSTGELHLLGELPERKKNIGFGVWDDPSLRPSQRSDFMNPDLMVEKDAEALLLSGAAETRIEALRRAEEKNMMREDPLDFTRALVKSGRAPDMEAAWYVTNEVFRSTDGGMYDQLAEEYKTMLHEYHVSQMTTAQLFGEGEARSIQELNVSLS